MWRHVSNSMQKKDSKMNATSSFVRYSCTFRWEITYQCEFKSFLLETSRPQSHQCHPGWNWVIISSHHLCSSPYSAKPKKLSGNNHFTLFLHLPLKPFEVSLAKSLEELPYFYFNGGAKLPLWQWECYDNCHAENWWLWSCFSTVDSIKATHGSDSSFMAQCIILLEASIRGRP